MPNTNEQTRLHFLSGSFEEKIRILKKTFQQSGDFEYRELMVNETKSALFFIKTRIDEGKLNDFIIGNLLGSPGKQNYIKSLSTLETGDLTLITDSIIAGSIAFLDENSSQIKLFAVGQPPLRSISEPSSESIIAGAHDGFVESLDTNIYLLRSHLNDRKLAIQYHKVGTKSETKLATVYISDIANQEKVEEVNRRISSIKVDTLISPGSIVEAIEEDSYSIFPQLIDTERPDKVRSAILEGRIVVLMDGSPMAIILPITFFSFFQSPDDYNSRWIPATFIRILRYLACIIAVILPSFYIAVIAFHYEVVPDELAITMKNSIIGIPFPPLIEAILMEITIELIREAGVRLPKPIGQTIGIVGGLVIGDAVVQAGLISNVQVIVVAVTAVASFVLPSFEMTSTIRMLRFPLMFMASMFGFIGISFGLAIILMNLCRLESLGVPYLSPVAPFNWQDLKDTVVRLPMWMYKNRPVYLNPQKDKQIEQLRGWTKKNEK
ncbi:spore germination protein KA [Bacillus safensis FO-36b]|uniref:spore germination protein n=1 Tax=Bacillus TaxID=1386 RepID=UPI00045CD51B|nr:spore germination protein [Bacillus safensis]ARD57752.1 spore germination protein [Bacillus safensis]AWI38402.1 spore gernimation protein GerK [Bacillus safensis FO-36b]KDE28351.1 spore germination protein KA [Bacillus safensis FO-36b]MCM2986331.1 spore germination protein [Bacillus safensis]MCM3048403.1 spore germination protein [Bacillus safensis]